MLHVDIAEDHVAPRVVGAQPQRVDQLVLGGLHVAKFKQRHRQFAPRFGHCGIEFEHPSVDVLRLPKLAAPRPFRCLLEEPASLRLLLCGRSLELDGGNAIADLDADVPRQVVELLPDRVDNFGSRKPSAQTARRKKFQVGKPNYHGDHADSLHCLAASFEAKLARSCLGTVAARRAANRTD